MKILFVLILTITIQGYGACNKAKVDFYFANGMFNDRASAMESLKVLKQHIAEKYPRDIYEQFELAYNTNEFILLQVLQVYRHKKLDENISFWKWLGEFSHFKDSDVFKELLERIFSSQLAIDSDLNNQIARYKKSLDEKHSIISVAHSQGNYYANFAFESLNTDKIKMISVATPASYVYKDGPYFTFKSDGAIAYIPEALPPNLDRDPAGLFDHEFVKHYLEYPLARNGILATAHKNYEEYNAVNADDLNSDLDKVLEWFEHNFKSKRSDKMSDCLLSYAVFRLIAANVECEEKNYLRLLKSLTDCREGRVNNKNKDTYCPFWLGMDFANFFYAEAYGFPLKGDSEFLDLHPHCQMDSYADYMDKIKSSDIEESIGTLEKLRSTDD